MRIMQCNSSNELHAVHHVGEMRLTFVVQNCMGTQILPNPNPPPQKNSLVQFFEHSCHLWKTLFNKRNVGS